MLKSENRQATWRRANPLKYKAHLAVQQAIKSGELEKQPCEVCGAEPVDAHHDRYDEPLNVRWLCRRHHVKLHHFGEDMFPIGQDPKVTHPHVVAVYLSAKHRFSKIPAFEIRVVAGLGVGGDAHFGTTTQHRYEKRYAPDRPNLRQVHLIDVALFSELGSVGFDVNPGDLGENIATSGLDLTTMPTRTILHIGDQAKLELTGLREPCVLLDRLRSGLRQAVEGLGPIDKSFLRGGVMSRVLQSGTIRPRDHLEIEYPSQPHKPLKNV